MPNLIDLTTNLIREAAEADGGDYLFIYERWIEDTKRLADRMSEKDFFRSSEVRELLSLFGDKTTRGYVQSLAKRIDLLDNEVRGRVNDAKVGAVTLLRMQSLRTRVIFLRRLKDVIEIQRRLYLRCIAWLLLAVREKQAIVETFDDNLRNLLKRGDSSVECRIWLENILPECSEDLECLFGGSWREIHGQFRREFDQIEELMRQCQRLKTVMAELESQEEQLERQERLLKDQTRAMPSPPVHASIPRKDSGRRGMAFIERRKRVREGDKTR